MRALSFEFFLLTLYTLCTGSILIGVQAPLFVIAAVLSLAPLLILWSRTELSYHLVPLLSLAAVSLTAIVELFAYTNGLWYEIDATSAPQWGGAPITAYVFSVVHILYCVVLYEYFFDDARNLGRSPNARKAVLSAILMYTVAAGYLYVQPAIFITYPFAVLLTGMCMLLAVLVAAKQQVPHMRLLWRAARFALLTLPLSIVYECVMLANNARFFANTSQYMYVFNFHGLSIPIEELFLILIVPFGVAVLYELYFDDGK